MTAPTTSKAQNAPQTRKQASASLLAKKLAVKLRWRTLIDEAQVTWGKISAAELATVEGSVHVLAGLVQLRHRLSRKDSDDQVKAFFTAHLLECTATAPTVVLEPRV